MNKTINICGYEIEVAVNAATLLKYKKAFHRDGFQDMMKFARVAGGKKKEDVIEIMADSDIDFDFVYRFLWVMASTAENGNKLDFEEFVEQFEVSPITFLSEAAPIVVSLLADNIKTTVKPKKK